ELAEAASLRTLVTEHWTDIRKTRHGIAVAERMLEVGADQRGRSLGSERERAPLPVLEGIELLLHDVGGFADASDEEIGHLEERRPHLAIAVAAQDVARPRLEPLPAFALAREDVARAARNLEFRPHENPSAAGRLGPLAAPASKRADGDDLRHEYRERDGKRIRYPIHEIAVAARRESLIVLVDRPDQGAEKNRRDGDHERAPSAHRESNRTAREKTKQTIFHQVRNLVHVWERTGDRVSMD